MKECCFRPTAEERLKASSHNRLHLCARLLVSAAAAEADVLLTWFRPALQGLFVCLFWIWLWESFLEVWFSLIFPLWLGFNPTTPHPPHPHPHYQLPPFDNFRSKHLAQNSPAHSRSGSVVWGGDLGTQLFGGLERLKNEVRRIPVKRGVQDFWRYLGWTCEQDVSYIGKLNII